MADDLLFVYSSPGPVSLDEFTDWYDNEHVPNRLAVPGFGAVARYRAADGETPDWLASYEIKPGTLDSPAYQALWETQSEREKRIMSAATIERRLFSPVYDSGPLASPAPVLLAVSMEVPPEVEADLEAHYAQEHFPMLLAVPGWLRARRYLLSSGAGPKYLSVHELASHAVFDEPAYHATTVTPWRKRILAAAIGRRKRVFDLHKSFG